MSIGSPKRHTKLQFVLIKEILKNKKMPDVHQQYKGKLLLGCNKAISEALFLKSKNGERTLADTSHVSLLIGEQCPRYYGSEVYFFPLKLYWWGRNLSLNPSGVSGVSEHRRGTLHSLHFKLQTRIHVQGKTGAAHQSTQPPSSI